MKSSLAHFIGVAALFVAIAGAYSFWYASVASESASVATLTQEIAAKTETVARASAVQEAIDKLSSDESAVQGYFVSEANVVPFLGELEATGKRLGTTVKVLSVAAGKDATAPSLLVGLSINGSFDAVMRTAGDIEYAPYALAVSNLALSKGGTDSAEWTGTMALTIGSTALSLPTTSSTPPATPQKAPAAPVPAKSGPQPI